jgi:hypothetical protein
MASSGDAFLAAVVTKGIDVAAVAHLGRRASAHQYTALQWRDPICDVEGCGNAWRLEVDHRADWAGTKVTALWLLDRYCGHHHDLKTYHGWASVAGVGKRRFVPPGHPDHPGDASRAPPIDEMLADLEATIARRRAADRGRPPTPGATFLRRHRRWRQRWLARRRRRPRRRLTAGRAVRRGQI